LLAQALAAQPAPSVLGLEPGTLQLSNDDLGLILWGPDAAPTLSVGKSDVWDRRNPKAPEPVLPISKIIERAKRGDSSILNGAAYYTAYNAHDFPCPKPVGQLIIQLDFLKPGGTLAVDHQPRRIVLSAAKGEKSLRLSLFVSAVRNLIVMEGEGMGLAEADISIRLYRHRDTILPGGDLHPTIGGGKAPNDFEQLPMPRAGSSKDLFWIAQDFPGEPTFPNGFTSLLAALVVGAEASYQVQTGELGLGTPMVAEQEGRISHAITKRYTPINQAPGSAATAKLSGLNGPFQIFATVVTTQEDPNPLERASDDLSDAARAGLSALWEEHQKQLDTYESQPHARAWSGDGTLKIDAPWGGLPYRVRPGGYYGDVPICSVGSTNFCFQDSSPWHGDFHFNELDAAGYCIQRQFDLLDSYWKMILALLPMAQANAREVYNCPGAMFPLVHYPLKADTIIHTHLSWEQSMEITALLLRPFWQRFLYTWDTAFLRDMAYPALREGARFYADFLKHEEDGLYHVFPTVSPEHRGITQDLAFNRDSQSAITLIRYHLRAASKAASILGLDESEAAQWREIAEHMPPYPTVESPEGPIFIDVAGAQPIQYNIAVPLSSVFWGDDIGLDSPPDQIELATRTLRQIDVWEPHRFYLAKVRKRLGIYEPADGLSLENLLQSHTGTIHVFPTVPEAFEGGFENLGAQPAFIVSSERQKSGVQSVSLTSLAGNDCPLANPWPESPAQVIDVTSGDNISFQTEGKVLRFATAPNHTYRVEPLK
jgi:hypothetical protein